MLVAPLAMLVGKTTLVVAGPTEVETAPAVEGELDVGDSVFDGAVPIDVGPTTLEVAGATDVGDSLLDVDGATDVGPTALEVGGATDVGEAVVGNVGGAARHSSPQWTTGPASRPLESPGVTSMALMSSWPHWIWSMISCAVVAPTDIVLVRSTAGPVSMSIQLRMARGTANGAGAARLKSATARPLASTLKATDAVMPPTVRLAAQG